MVKFSELQIGERFRYQNQEFKKTLPVDMGSVIYNAITDEVMGWSNVVFMRDWQRVHKICPTPVAADLRKASAPPVKIHWKEIE